MADLNLIGFDVVAELAVGLAGFSGVLIVLIKPSGGFTPPENFRLLNLVYSSVGVMFLAILPFSITGIDWNPATSWKVLGTVSSIYTIGGLLILPRRVLALMKDYPDLFPVTLFLIQTSLHTAAVGFSLSILFELSPYPSRMYFLLLFLLLLHSAITYVRVLFYRRPIDEDSERAT